MPLLRLEVHSLDPSMHAAGLACTSPSTLPPRSILSYTPCAPCCSSIHGQSLSGTASSSSSSSCGPVPCNRPHPIVFLTFATSPTCMQRGRRSRWLISVLFRLLHPYYWPPSLLHWLRYNIEHAPLCFGGGGGGGVTGDGADMRCMLLWPLHSVQTRLRVGQARSLLGPLWRRTPVPSHLPACCSLRCCRPAASLVQRCKARVASTIRAIPVLGPRLLRAPGGRERGRRGARGHAPPAGGGGDAAAAGDVPSAHTAATMAIITPLRHAK